MIDTINFFLFWAGMIVLGWNAYILVFNRGVPNIRTARPCRQKMVDLVRQDWEDKGCPPDYKVADLGSGNGHFTRELARALPGAQIYGYEIAKFSILKSRIWQKWARLHNIRYIKGDFFKQDLSQLNAIVFFMSAYEISKMGEKLRSNASPGTLILSNRFALKGWTGGQEYEAKTKWYKQGKIYSYRIQDYAGG